MINRNACENFSNSLKASLIKQQDNKGNARVAQKCWNKKHIHRLEEVEAEEEAAGDEEIPENAQVDPCSSLS